MKIPNIFSARGISLFVFILVVLFLGVTFNTRVGPEHFVEGAQGNPAQGVPARSNPAQSVPARSNPAQGVPVQSNPAQSSYVQSSYVQKVINSVEDDRNKLTNDLNKLISLVPK